MTIKITATPDDVTLLAHVGLRKCCDSHVTSAAWNLLHIVEGDDRAWLIARMVAGLEDAQKHALADGVLETAFKRALTLDNADWPVVGYLRRALVCVFRAFDEHDWSGMTAFMRDP